LQLLSLPACHATHVTAAHTSTSPPAAAATPQRRKDAKPRYSCRAIGVSFQKLTRKFLEGDVHIENCVR
jgi:hypothetical protein